LADVPDPHTPGDMHIIDSLFSNIAGIILGGIFFSLDVNFHKNYYGIFMFAYFFPNT